MVKLAHVVLFMPKPAVGQSSPPTVPGRVIQKQAQIQQLRNFESQQIQKARIQQLLAICLSTRLGGSLSQNSALHMYA